MVQRTYSIILILLIHYTHPDTPSTTHNPNKPQTPTPMNPTFHSIDKNLHIPVNSPGFKKILLKLMPGFFTKYLQWFYSAAEAIIKERKLHPVYINKNNYYLRYYPPHRSCGKVMFLHLSGHDHCSGRYASYRNAFLFQFKSLENKYCIVQCQVHIYLNITN